MLDRFGQLLPGSVDRIARRHELLAHLPGPLLDEGVAIGNRRGELVLAFDKAIAIEVLSTQYFEALIGGRQQVEAAAELAGRQTRPHAFYILRDLHPAVIMGEIVLELADRRLVLRDLLIIGAQLRFELAFALRV